MCPCIKTTPLSFSNFGRSKWLEVFEGFFDGEETCRCFCRFEDDRIFGLVILLMVTRNPARKPVEVGSLSHYWQRFSTIPGGWPWDFWTINSIMTPLFQSCCCISFVSNPFTRTPQVRLSVNNRLERGSKLKGFICQFLTGFTICPFGGDWRIFGMKVHNKYLLEQWIIYYHHHHHHHHHHHQSH